LTSTSILLDYPVPSLLPKEKKRKGEEGEEEKKEGRGLESEGAELGWNHLEWLRAFVHL